MEQQRTLLSIQRVLKNGPVAQWPGPGSALSVAVRAGRVDLARVLLLAKANANQRDDKGVSPLHLAAFDGNVGLCRVLLVSRADVDSRDRHGQTPLFFSPSREVCKLLVEKRADLTLLNHKGQSALHLAGRAGLQEVLAWLSMRVDKAFLDLKDTRGQTARGYVAQAELRSAESASGTPASDVFAPAPQPSAQRKDPHGSPNTPNVPLLPLSTLGSRSPSEAEFARDLAAGDMQPKPAQEHPRVPRLDILGASKGASGVSSNSVQPGRSSPLPRQRPNAATTSAGPSAVAGRRSPQRSRPEVIVEDAHVNFGSSCGNSSSSKAAPSGIVRKGSIGQLEKDQQQLNHLQQIQAQLLSSHGSSTPSAPVKSQRPRSPHRSSEPLAITAPHHQVANSLSRHAAKMAARSEPEARLSPPSSCSPTPGGSKPSSPGAFGGKSPVVDDRGHNPFSTSRSPGSSPGSPSSNSDMSQLESAAMLASAAVTSSAAQLEQQRTEKNSRKRLGESEGGKTAAVSAKVERPPPEQVDDQSQQVEEIPEEPEDELELEASHEGEEDAEQDHEEQAQDGLVDAEEETDQKDAGVEAGDLLDLEEAW